MDGNDLRRTHLGMIGRAWAVTAAAAVTMTACAPERPPDRQPTPATTGEVAERPLIQDLVPLMSSARVVRAVRTVEPGNPAHAGSLLGGWGGGEVHGSSGDSFAWVVAREAGVRVLRLDAGPAEIAVMGWPFLWRGGPDQQLELTVNGSSVGTERLGRGDNTVTFQVPEGLLRVGINTIGLHFAHTGMPAEVNPGATDQRTLAAAVRRVEIRSPGDRATEADTEPRLERAPLRLPSDTGASVTLRLKGDVALELEATAVAASDDRRPRIVVWQGSADRNPVPILDRAVSKDASVVRVPLESTEGGLQRIGFAAVGGDVEVNVMRLVGEGRAAVPRNLLLIVMDTLRADRVGSYGGAAATPAIDGLAAQGTLFERAYSHIAITGPSHASMFTSLHPFEHGVHNNAQILAEDHVTLAEALRDNGWFTAGVVSLGVLMRDYGVAQGFDVYRDRFERDWMKNAGEVTDEALEVLDEGLPEPYFFWVHYSDPHEPYAPPGLDYPRARVDLDGRPVAEVTADGRGYLLELELAPGTNQLRFAPVVPDRSSWFRVGAVTLRAGHTELVAPEQWSIIKDAAGFRTYTARLPAALELVNRGDRPERVELHFIFKRRLHMNEVKRRYLMEVEYADGQIGRLLEALDDRGLLENTVVVFTSDHGEGLGDHNHLGHIHQVYDSLTRVPLIITVPGDGSTGRRVRDRVALVDLFPTVADLLGVAGPDPASGRSLVPALSGASLPPRDVIAETYRPEAFTDKRSIIRNGVKFIHSWSDVRGWEELYDLESDPGELRDLVEERPAVADELRKALVGRMRQAPGHRAEKAELSEEDLDQLRALGYVH